MLRLLLELVAEAKAASVFKEYTVEAVSSGLVASSEVSATVTEEVEDKPQCS